MATEATLLIEIGTEELPPNHLGRLSQAFANEISAAFQQLGIAFTGMENFTSPRRIAARFFGVPLVQPGRQIKRRGPSLAGAFDANGTPTPAAVGFAKSCGVEITALKTEETPQGAWLFYEFHEEGKPLQALLSGVIEKAINTIPAVKKMRWGDGVEEFLRPLHWLCVMHGKTTLPVQAFGLTASSVTHGHRVHFPGAIEIPDADNYLTVLRDAKVIVDQNERRDIIEKDIIRLAEQNGGKPIIDSHLLDQVSGLVEWPVPLYAHFAKEFLDVPQEALISSMQNHQKCFPIKNSLDKLMPIFVLISNTDAKDPAMIIRGNERVMKARLSDAKFFYDQDRKIPLTTRLEGLKNMVFQKKLGTLYAKTQRISKLAGLIAKQLGLNPRMAERAGKLSKADLLTEMVFEFPELQGIMGCYYARHDGEPEDVCVAIRESYLPRFAKDVLPETQTGICVALADRLDTLVGIFGIGQMPTGDKDPFALRRQALGILRILIEKNLPLDLEDLCQMARHGYGNLIDEEVVPQVVNFCFERFKAWYQEQGISAQVIEAVMINRPTSPYDCARRVLAVNHFQALPEAQHLAQANKRVRNILQKSGFSLNLQQLPHSDPKLLTERAERGLNEAIELLAVQTEPLIQQGKYQEALSKLAQLQKPVDDFFNDVMVMTDDEALKQNRIRLLGHLSGLFMQIADISKLAL